MVDLQLPMKSYLIMDSGLMLTPISVEQRKIEKVSICSIIQIELKHR